MATKSVGTLAAKLLLDTKGWTGGFANAQKSAQDFGRKGPHAAGRQVRSLTDRILAFGITAAVAKKAFTTISNAATRTFANIEKTGGLGLNTIQVNRVVAANNAVRDLAKS